LPIAQFIPWDSDAESRLVAATLRNVADQAAELVTNGVECVERAGQQEHFAIQRIRFRTASEILRPFHDTSFEENKVAEWGTSAKSKTSDD